MNGLIETRLAFNPTPAQLHWLDTQYKATNYISGDAQERAHRGEESLYGLPMADIVRAIPAATGLSSYVSLGMSRISAATLLAYLQKHAFQYRASKAGSIRPHNGKIYISGIPDCYLDINGAPLPGDFKIVSVVFEKDRLAGQWYVVVRQSVRPPPAPRKKHKA